MRFFYRRALTLLALQVTVAGATAGAVLVRATRGRTESIMDVFISDMPSASFSMTLLLVTDGQRVFVCCPFTWKCSSPLAELTSRIIK